MLFCKDCKFFQKTTLNGIDCFLCKHDSARELVTGEHGHCWDSRLNSGHCGIHAVNFIAKEADTPLGFSFRG